MKQAIPYIRFSSFKQVEGNSYQRQQEAVQRWLRAHPDYALSSLVFEDLGKSGFSTKASKKASGMVKIREAIEAGLIQEGDAVLVEAFDRATRQQALEAIELITPILKAGVSIITLDDGIEYTQQSLNGSHAYLLVAKIQAAYGYSKILSERVTESYNIRRKGALKGEKVRRATPVWLTTDGQVIEAISPYVKQVFELYIAGVGKTAIANRLRASGVEALAKCSGPTVEGWLRNRAVIGYWNDIPGVYPPIVEPELFYLAQKRKEQVATKRPEKTAKHFLVGLVKCGVCGGNYIVNNVNGAPYNMRCSNRHRLKDNGCSNTKSIPKNVLEYVRLSTSLDAVEEALSKQTLTSSEKRRIQLNSELEAVGQNIHKLVQLVAVVDDIAEVSTQLQELKEKRNALQEELTSLTEGAEEERKRWLTAFDEEKMFRDDPILLNALLRSVGYCITVHEDGLIKVSNEIYPFLYTGVKRKAKSNETEAYKVQYMGEELLVSATQLTQELKELVWDDQHLRRPNGAVEGLLLLMKRQADVIRP